MKSIVITAGTAVGSVLALAGAIKTKFDCKTYVICTDKKTSKVIALSKFIDDVIFIDSKNEKDYISDIKIWYKFEEFKEIPILYFTSDTSCFYIDNNRSWFDKNFKLCLPSSDIVQTFTRKGEAETRAAELSLIVPKTKVIQSHKDVGSILSDFQFPIIIKPLATYLDSDFYFKIKVIENKHDLSVFIKTYNIERYPVLCQEFIPGGDDTSYYYIFYRSKDGVIFESIGKKKLQSTSNGGIMLKGMSEFDIELSTICRTFLNRIDYCGIGGLEFKKHDGRFYFIEMSVRLEGFFKMSEISKTPLSIISYYDLTDIDIPSEVLVCKQEDGIYYVDFISTLISRVKSRSFISLIYDVVYVLFKPNLRLNVLSFGDYKPFLKQVVNLFISHKNEH